MIVVVCVKQNEWLVIIFLGFCYMFNDKVEVELMTDDKIRTRLRILLAIRDALLQVQKL